MSSIRTVARDAFVYGLPTVDLYRILRNFSLEPTSPEFKAPLNEIGHSRRLSDPSDLSIVAMNVDTPYSYAWLDLRAEPMVLTMPAHEDDRYVSAQIVDLYTYIVGYVSPRTTGRHGGDYLIAGPEWQGLVPDGMTVFRVPTELAVVLIRTQLFGPEDLPEVIALQSGMHVTPLSTYTGGRQPSSTPPLEPMEPCDVRGPADLQFLKVLDWMLQYMPVLADETEIREELCRLGAGTGRVDQMLDTPTTRDESIAGMADGLVDVVARTQTVRSSAELFGSREFLGHDYLTRAAGALLGILGNAAEEYLGVGYQGDADGHPFDGSHEYRITFTDQVLPPVDAFWSITVYDDDQHLYANPIDRYALSSRDVGSMYRDDRGAITIRVQNERPPEHLLPNWLPCPAGQFRLTFRTYLPRESIRDGSWTAPGVQRSGAMLTKAT